MKKTQDIAVHWRSFELRPSGSPPISPAYRARIEAGRTQFQQRVQAQYGVEINSGPFGVDSRPALVLTKYAEAQGKGEAFHRAVMDAYWLQARAIDNTDVLKEIAMEVGLETDQLAALLSDPEYDAAVSADIAQAHTYGLDSVPSLIFAEKYLIVGAQPTEVLRQVVEKIQAEE